LTSSIKAGRNCSSVLRHILGIHQQIISKPPVSGNEELGFGGGGIALEQQFSSWRRDYWRIRQEFH
jgi:hypothetical protein